MSRILTGIQSSGVPHLGNILGAVVPAIELSKDNESFFFIADLHALTTVKNKTILKKNILATAAVWLAFGLDTKKPPRGNFIADFDMDLMRYKIQPNEVGTMEPQQALILKVADQAIQKSSLKINRSA